MDKQKPEAWYAAGGASMRIIDQQAPFSASGNEKIAAFLMYIAAYLYIRNAYTLVRAHAPSTRLWLIAFTLIFLFLTELLHRDTPRPRESWVWLGCMAANLAGCALRQSRVWENRTPLFLHIFAVWWVLNRSGRLAGGESGRLLPLDALNGFVMLPFRNFFLRIRTVRFTLARPGRRARPEAAAWAALAVLAAGGLFAAAVSLLTRADSGFAALMDRAAALLRFGRDVQPLFLVASLPVGAYLHGLIAGSAREDPEDLRARGEALCAALERLRRVPNRIWAVLTGLFCLLYAVFFLVQARYLFGAFFRALPEGFIVSEYARQGFFELCKVMAVNFILLWLVARSSLKPLRESRPEKVLCLALLAESLLFAAVAFSKLLLYISCFGFTPLRLQSTWLVCVLACGCVCAAVSLASGKKTFRLWMIFGAVTLSLLALY